MKKRKILGIEVDDSVYEYSERDEVDDNKKIVDKILGR